MVLPGTAVNQLEHLDEELETLRTSFDTSYAWRYGNVKEGLRDLYEKAKREQWNGTTQLKWDTDVDPEHGILPEQLNPLNGFAPYERLTAKEKDHLRHGQISLQLSQFLHGEQGALIVASQLVGAVPWIDAKYYAGTQTMDEARHVEVFARYIEKLDEIRPIAPSLKGILDTTLETGDWMKKLVGMQIVVEGLALYAFREMRNTTEEPLLKELLTYVARDESRHHAYGVQYIERCVPCLSDAARGELEDFALECARTLIDRNSQGFFTTLLQIWQEVGVDPVAMLTSLDKERHELVREVPRGKRLGPVQGFVIPTLRRCGLLSERVASHFHGFLRENFGSRVAGENVDEFLRILPDLPADTARWVMGEIQ